MPIITKILSQTQFHRLFSILVIYLLIHLGCVVMSYGSGNTPSNPEFLEVFKSAIERGVIIVNISQCWKAATNDSYTTGKVFH